MAKYVASTTLKDLEWDNSHLIEGDVPEAVAKLKQRPGQDLIMYGSDDLMHSLLELERQREKLNRDDWTAFETRRPRPPQANSIVRCTGTASRALPHAVPLPLFAQSDSDRPPRSASPRRPERE
jgi:hypothetical protein